jgi:hypothetical protein
MTYAEVCRLVAVVQALWPHQRLALETPKVWFSLLEGFTLEDAEAGVRELAAEGREWPPPVGVIVKTLADRSTEIPEWDQAWHKIGCLIRRYGSYRLPPDEAFSHPVIAAFARPAWQELCTAPAPGTNGHGTHKAQQREAYNAMRTRAHRDTGLLAIGAPRSAGLRRLSPGAAGILPPEGAA